MATYTSNYGWTKPSGSDNVDISVLNNNLDDQDSTIHDAFLNMAPPFSESSTYAVDDIVLYGTGLYKCHTAVVTPGSWTGSTNWQVYKLSEGGSGGGTSDYDQLTNHPSINGVELSGNKTGAQLGLQNALTFDNVPTANSNNPVKSGGVYSADEAIRKWTTSEAKSVSGNPITLTDGSARNAEGLVVTLEPKQSGSGTPSPTNVRPITGLTECVVDDHGENLLEPKLPTLTLNGITFTNYGDGSFRVNGTATAKVNFRIDQSAFDGTDNLKNYPKGNYCVSGLVNGVALRVMQNLSWITILNFDYQTQSINLTNSWDNCFILLTVLEGVTIDATISPMFTRSSTPQKFSPYQGDTATITFGQTVYGGSVDFKTGSGKTTYKSVTVTEFLGKDGSTHNNFYFSVSDAKLPSANTDIVDVSSNMFASGYSYERMYRADTGGVSITTSGLCVVSFGADSEINTLALANAWLAENSLQVVYELAIPIELTLTPAELELLKGYNYITTNGTTIALAYLPDSLLAEMENYVDAKIPPAPSSDGTYVLTCTVESGTPAYTWESAT